MLLAPLRGVTIRTFRRVFADAIRESGFTEAVTPFVAANAGFDPLRDRELAPPREALPGLRVTPQFIGKDPAALRASLERVKAAGWETADLNAGCPYPMIRGKGRGSGLLRTPDVLRRLLEAGCETMGAGHFSVKTRLGIDRADELLNLMPIFNEFPLRFLTVHARTARQMYEGACDREAFAEIEAVAKMPIIANGDLPFGEANSFGRANRPGEPRLGKDASPYQLRLGKDASPYRASRVMVGRAFIRALGERDDIGELLDRYVDASRAELCGARPVLGRIKELLAYWKDSPRWRRRWQVAKIARTLDELRVW